MSKKQEHSEKDLEKIFREHSEQILRQIRGMVANPDDAEDLTQEVFLRAQDALPKFRGESKLTTWLARIAANACVDAGRNAARRAKRETVELSDDQHPPVVELNLVSSLLDDEQQGWLREVLTELPPDQVLLLSLRYSDQLTYREIADVMGVAEWDVINHIRTLLSRIDRSLKFKEFVAERNGYAASAPGKPAPLDGLVVTGKGSEQVYYNLGTLYLRKGLVEAAIREWRKAHELAPDFIEPCLAIADQYVATNRPAEAVTYLENVVRDVKSPELHTRLGESYVGIEDYRRAVYHCQQAIKLQPDTVRAHIILNKIHRRQAVKLRRTDPAPLVNSPGEVSYKKHLVKSLSYLRKAFELDPNEPVTMAELVRTMLLLSDMSDTIGVCEKMLARFPEVPYVQYAAAQVYEAAGQLDRAVKLYLQSLEKHENAWIRVRLASTYNKAGEFNKALKEFQKLAIPVETAQYVSTVYAGIAASYLGLGKIPEALSAAQKAYDCGQDPIDGRCKLSLMHVLLQENLEEAEQLAREGLAEDRHHYCFSFVLSRINVLRGNGEEALRWAKPIAELLPESPEARTQVGLSHLIAGNREEAESALKKALELFPGHEEAVYALSIITSGKDFDPAKLPLTTPRPHLAYCMKASPWI